MNIDKDTWHVIHSYFDETPNYLTKHHIDSFNDFILNRIPATFNIPNLNPQKILVQDKKNPNIKYEMSIYYGGKDGKGIYMSKPTIFDALTQEMRPMYPNEARLKNLTYASHLFIDVDIECTMTQDDKIIYENVPHPVPSILKKLNLGRMPIMLRSKPCALYNATPDILEQMGESRFEHGGYFIIDGMEKVVLSQERKAENKLYVLESKDDLYDYSAHVKSVSKEDFVYPKTTYVHMMAKTKSITAAISYLKKGNKSFDVPLFAFFRALGVESDEEILKYILYDLDSDKSKHFMELLRPSIEEAEQLKIYDQLTALTFLEKYPDKVSDELERGGNEMIRNAKIRLSFLYDAIYKSLFPHVGDSFVKKAYYLGYVVNQLLHVAAGLKQPTDRDSWRYKRIDLSGFLLANLFREKVMRLSWTVRTQVETKYEFAHSDFSGDNFIHIINETNLHEFFDYKIIEHGFKDAFKMGEITKKKGLIQNVERLSINWFISYLRRVNTPDDLGTRMPIGQRMIHGTQYGIFCIAETPSGGVSCGLKKQLGIMSHVTFGSKASLIEDFIRQQGLLSVEDVHPTQTLGKTKVFINGDWIGVHEHPDKLVNLLRNMRRNGLINVYTSIAWRIQDMEIHLYTDGGRGCYPIYIVKNNRLLLTPEHIEGVRNGKYKWINMISGFKNKKTPFDYFQNFLDPAEEGYDITNLNQDLEKYGGVVEYLDTEEIDTCLFSPSMNIPTTGMKRFTHCELHPALIMGVIGSMIPFSHHSQSPRNVYGTSQNKQSVSYYIDNYRNRMEKANMLYSPQRPLIGTRTRKYFMANDLPSGQNVIVAISTYGGYNQEDSVIMNWSSLQRGLFMTTAYKMYQKTEMKDTKTGNEELFYNPLKLEADTEEESQFSRKFQGYSFDKLDEYGFIKEGTYLTGKEIMIGAYAKVKNRDGKTENVDISLPSKSKNALVDKVFTCYTNNDRHRLCKIRIAQERMPEFGDKFACYDPETEILTRDRGWIKFPDLIKDDRVATMTNKGTLHYEEPLEIQEYDYKGKMYQIKNNTIDLLVTPNHRMYTRSKDTKSKYNVQEAKDIEGVIRKYKKNFIGYEDSIYQDYFIIPAFENEKAKTISMHHWLQFFGIWIAEGCLTNEATVTISAHKQRVKDVLEVVVPAMCYKLGKTWGNKTDTVKNTYRIYNKQLAQYMKQFGEHAQLKHLPDWVWDLTPEHCKTLIHGMMLGDGHTMKNGTRRYDTSSKELADQFQRLCIHAGWNASISLKYEAGNTTTIKSRNGIELDGSETITSNFDAYRLTIIETQLEPIVNKTVKQDKWIDYSGKVHCCTVDSGIIMVRRNMKAVLSGNSSHGQKGTIGMRFLGEDMPFTQSGLSPDIIINPHAIPSRMTIGQLIESVFGKAGATLGFFGDATPFNYVDSHNIAHILEEQCGLSRYGDETLYNGQTGEQLQCSIFIGPTYYQRLKHMVQDKINARSAGSRDVYFNMPAQGGGYTARERQPPGGRALDGGLRIGEMERDAVLAHGLHAFLKESMMERSDKFTCFICDTSGRIAVANPFENNIYYSPDIDGPVSYHMTETAGIDTIKSENDDNSFHKLVGVNILNQTAKDFSQVQIPYTFKLLIQECESIAISMRLISENNMYNFNQLPIDKDLLEFEPDIDNYALKSASKSFSLKSFIDNEPDDESEDKSESDSDDESENNKKHTKSKTTHKKDKKKDNKKDDDDKEDKEDKDDEENDEPEPEKEVPEFVKRASRELEPEILSNDEVKDNNEDNTQSGGGITPLVEPSLDMFVNVGGGSQDGGDRIQSTAHTNTQPIDFRHGTKELTDKLSDLGASPSSPLPPPQPNKGIFNQTPMNTSDAAARSTIAEQTRLLSEAMSHPETNQFGGMANDTPDTDPFGRMRGGNSRPTSSQSEYRVIKLKTDPGGPPGQEGGNVPFYPKRRYNRNPQFGQDGGNTSNDSDSDGFNEVTI